MPFQLFDYVNANGENEFKVWSSELQKPQLAKLNQLLDKLEMHGLGLLPKTLTGTEVAGIMKLRGNGNVQLRPMLCKGPVNPNAEFTLLLGAKEVGGEYDPVDAPGMADARKSIVASNPSKRRTKHERVSFNIKG